MPAREASAPGAAAGMQDQFAAPHMAAPGEPGCIAPAGAVAAAEAAAAHQMRQSMDRLAPQSRPDQQHVLLLQVNQVLNIVARGMQTSSCAREGWAQLTWGGQPEG